MALLTQNLSVMGHTRPIGRYFTGMQLEHANILQYRVSFHLAIELGTLRLPPLCKHSHY